ncbi:pseudouridine synthase family protein [Leptolyngbyaceae cyanobacterium JSC-12]|nr:pseudouridine synthase family protein [Leptolyngbyaceae cyanobacterium JSC-12]
MSERLQKVLSQLGVASRRHAEQMIQAGRVLVNNQPAHLGQKIHPDHDQITVDGELVSPSKRPDRICLLLNKPAGMVCTCEDPQGRPTVLDLLPEELQQGQGIHPVGRLDVDSTGALLLTNDGTLTFYLTHPRHHIPKTYQVWVEGKPPEPILEQWRRGVMLDNRLTLPASVSVLQYYRTKTLLEIVLREGRNRQIRRVAEQLGHPVLRLHRTAIGAIQLQPPGHPKLPSGSYRVLSNFEICFLKSQIDLTSDMELKSEECSV